MRQMKLDIGWGKLNYREQGSGLPVIFVHAFPLNHSMWDEQIDFFASKHRPIAPDLRGFGESDLADQQFSIEDMASDIKMLMDGLAIQRAVMVGLSMGGYIAMSFYRHFAENLRALVLADTRSTADTEEGRARRLQTAEKAEQFGASAIADDMISVLIGPTTRSNRPDVVTRVRRMIETTRPEAIAAAQRAMASRADSTELLRAARLPVLLLTGEEDSLYPPAEAQNLSAIIPGAQLRTIERAGHLSNLEQPALFNAALSDFLTGIDMG